MLPIKAQPLLNRDRIFDYSGILARLNGINHSGRVICCVSRRYLRWFTRNRYASDREYGSLWERNRMSKTILTAIVPQSACTVSSSIAGARLVDKAIQYMV